MTDTRALQSQLRADPRVQTIVTRQRTGGLTATQLRALGYDVPDGYHYTFGGRAGYGTLMDDKQSFIESGKPAILMGAAAGGLALAPAVAGAGAGSSAAATGAAPAATGGGMAGFWSSPLALNLVGQGIGAGTNLIGAKMQSTAAGKAAAAQQAANTQSLDFLKSQDARDFAEYLTERNRLWGNEDVDRGRAEENRQLALQREREREGRLAPFREGAADSYQALKSLLQLPAGGVMRTAPISPATLYQDPRLADLLRRS